MDILIAVLLVVVTSFSLHVFIIIQTRVQLKVNRSFVFGFIFVSFFRAALAFFCGYVLALMLNRLNEVESYLEPLMLFLLSLPLLLLTAGYSYFNYRRDKTRAEKRIAEYKRQTSQPDGNHNR